MARFCILSFLMAYILGFNPLQAQQFGASIVGGLNAAQITGDDLAGYNKPGILLGLKSSIYLSDRSDLNIELLYSERGSKSAFFNNARLDQQIKLQYLEIPILFTYMDWLSSDAEYYRMHFHGGLSFARLFNSKLIDDQFNFQLYENNLNNTDLSFIFGFTYQMNNKIGAGIRYTSSINKLYKQDDSGLNLNELRGYFLSLRLEYSLL